jgi:hypothetical protein
MMDNHIPEPWEPKELS